MVTSKGTDQRWCCWTNGWLPWPTDHVDDELPTNVRYPVHRKPRDNVDGDNPAITNVDVATVWTVLCVNQQTALAVMLFLVVDILLSVPLTFHCEKYGCELTINAITKVMCIKYLWFMQFRNPASKGLTSVCDMGPLIFLRRPNLFAICNNIFSKWWESVKDGLQKSTQ
jgi:hypothetical protein